MRKTKIALLAIYLLWLLKGALITQVSASAVMFWSVDALFSLVLLLVILFFTVRSDGADRLNIGMRDIRVADIGAGLFTGALLLAVDVIATTIFSRVFSPGPSDWSYQMFTPAGGVARAGTVLYLCLTAAVFEEFFFRGLLSQVVRSSPVFVLLSAFTFGGLHWAHGWGSVISLTFFGAVAASMYRGLGRRLAPLIIGHFIVALYSFA